MHCPVDKIADLDSVFTAMRNWPGIKEKSIGVFYLRSTPFLHFHPKDEDRWADVREGKTWGERVAIPLHASKAKRDGFLREVRRRYDLMTNDL